MKIYHSKILPLKNRGKVRGKIRGKKKIQKNQGFNAFLTPIYTKKPIYTLYNGIFAILQKSICRIAELQNFKKTRGISQN